MTTETILLVVVLILVYLHFTEAGKEMHAKWWAKLDEIKATKPAAAPAAPVATEAAATKENLEYFSSCGDGNIMNCDGTDMRYATDEFGGPGLSYKDWAAMQVVDDSVIRNHKQFVADRSDGDINKQNITGRTFAMDAHESLQQVPWIGIRGRPQMTSQCNPTQVPDVYDGAYSESPNMTWRSN